MFLKRWCRRSKMISDKVKVGDTVRYIGGGDGPCFGFPPERGELGKVRQVDDSDDTISVNFENCRIMWVYFGGCEVVHIVESGSSATSGVWKSVGSIDTSDIYSSAVDTGWVQLDRTVGDWLRSRSDRELAEICAAHIECDACEKLLGRSEDCRRPCEIDGIGCYAAWEKYLGSQKAGGENDG